MDPPNSSSQPKRRYYPRRRRPERPEIPSGSPPEESQDMPAVAAPERQIRAAVPRTRPPRRHIPTQDADQPSRPAAPLVHRRPAVEAPPSNPSRIHQRRVPPPRVNLDDNIVERMIRDLYRGCECMICMTAVKFSQSVWSCKVCYAVMHLGCVHQWIKRNAGSNTTGCEWRCPGCQYVYVEEKFPKYSCFCGRLDNPPASRQYTPHSCGEPCSRARPDCAHPCTLSCHPGPCPPCGVLLPRIPCYGGHDATEAIMSVKCGDRLTKPHSCGSVCGRNLQCGKHVCKNLCHAGSCGPCSDVTGETVSCYCSGSRKPVFCGTTPPPFSCGKICTKKFPCQVHACTKTCHAGSCGVCPLSPTSYGEGVCACGNSVLPNSPPRKLCTDPLPTCEKICTKYLPACGHNCQSRCHSGPCPACQVSVVQHCRCGQSKRTVACAATASSNQFICDKICKTIKSCSKHKCDLVCCSAQGQKNAECHLCFLPCGKLLTCGQHTCDELCHLGKCKSCRVVIRDRPISCGCGRHTIGPPVACGTPKPVCHSLCGKPLAGCAHTCPSPCHEGACSLCTFLVDKPCAGGHTVLSSVRCHATNVSCGSKCGKPLPCGVHVCALNCHAGECVAEDKKCPQVCTVSRPACGHICGARCHGTTPCPKDFACRARVTVSCACGLRSEETACTADHANLPCSLECERHQRQTALRQAFRSSEDIENGSEKYSGDLVSQVERHDQKFIRLIDSILTDAVDTRANTVHLPAVDANRRWITLEYAQLHYRFDAEVVKDGEGPHEKAVVVHFVPGQTRTPNPTLSQLTDMLPSQALKYTVDFDTDGPSIHFYDVARGYGKLTAEKIRNTLKSFIGAYRTRRGDGFDLFLDFFDANKALAAFRKLQSTTGLEQCRLVNVPLFENTDHSAESPSEPELPALE